MTARKYSEWFNIMIDQIICSREKWLTVKSKNDPEILTLNWANCKLINKPQ